MRDFYLMWKSIEWNCFTLKFEQAFNYILNNYVSPPLSHVHSLEELVISAIRWNHYHGLFIITLLKKSLFTCSSNNVAMLECPYLAAMWRSVSPLALGSRTRHPHSLRILVTNCSETAVVWGISSEHLR